MTELEAEHMTTMGRFDVLAHIVTELLAILPPEKAALILKETRNALLLDSKNVDETPENRAYFASAEETLTYISSWQPVIADRENQS